MRRLSLHAPATIADVIGWTIAVPVGLFALLALPSMAHVPSKAQASFREFGVPASWQLEWVFGLQDAGLMALIVAIAVGPLVALSFARRAGTKVVAPICGAMALLWLYWFVFGSVFEQAARIMASMPDVH